MTFLILEQRGHLITVVSGLPQFSLQSQLLLPHCVIISCELRHSQLGFPGTVLVQVEVAFQIVDIVALALRELLICVL